MDQTKLSVNINKIAALRNTRGGNNPDLIKVAKDIERFGADGITVHPRPDERHIRYADVYDLKKIVTTEFNIEGNPKEKKFVELVLANKPTQVTLVPDAKGQITSDHGWDTIKNKDYLKEIISVFKNEGIRVSIFVDPDIAMVRGAKETGTDRIELYTEGYSRKYEVVNGQLSTVNSQQSIENQKSAISPYISAAKVAMELGLGINAGHDLSLQNLKYFAQNIPGLLEVSIGHALICDAIYLGLENAVQLYKRQLKNEE
ncbi:MAG: pyridoxine 5'-phosphate synthase [Ginsengibacter sp.]